MVFTPSPLLANFLRSGKCPNLDLEAVEEGVVANSTGIRAP
jgi:hypothetical protein